MNKREIITGIILVLLLGCGVAAGIIVLYSDEPEAVCQEGVKSPAPKPAARPEAIPADSTDFIPADSTSAIPVEEAAGELVEEPAEVPSEETVETPAASPVIPDGPFTVTDGTSGLDAQLSQNQDLDLILSQNGKTLWTYKMNGKICGAAGSLDYYGNGKIQTLVCTSDSFVLIDRLGRIVKGFPVSLPKKALLGPVVTEISKGAARALILHEDNTIEMYNLHGQKVGGWKTIAPKATILGLPVLTADNEWEVRTSDGIQTYPFMGGEKK